MADTPKRFIGPVGLAAATATLATVTSGKTWRLVHIHIVNTDTVNRTINFAIGADAATTRIISNLTLQPSEAYDANCFYVCAAGEILTGFASAASVCTITVDGIESP